MSRRRSGRVSETARMMRMLGRYARGHRGVFWLALAMLAFEAVTAVVEALPLAYIIDYLKDETTIRLPGGLSGRTATVAVLTIAIVLIAVVNSLADSMAEIYLARGGRKLGYKLRVAVFSHLQNLSIAFHDQRRTGDVITRVTGDVNEVEDFITKNAPDFVGSVLLLIGSLTFLVYKTWQVAVLALLIIPVLAVISHYFSSRIRDVAKRQRARQGDLASSTQEMLTAIRVVQIFGRHRHDEGRFAGQSKHAMDAALDLARLEAMFSFVVSLLQALCIASVIWIGIWLIDRNALTVGTLVFLVLLVKSMFRPTRRIIKEWNAVGKLYASVERINELLDREPSVRDAPDAVPAPRLRGAVEFRDVEFAYQLESEDVPEGADVATRRALRNISFSIEPGQVVALVGHSGAGKSTVAQLLPRLYDPQAGAVLLDGHDVRTFTLESLRSQISMVLQETMLFSGTVAENIAYGRTDATRDEIVAAAVRANAHEFISQMADGYDTDLTERATNLSGGQRQRIAIARAFIRDTPLLILDEPTTGLDTASTVSVLQALRTLMRGKTTLIISHELNLFRDADRIIVLDSGRIVQTGTHEQLLRQGGAYAQLYRRQFGEIPLPVPQADRAVRARPFTAAAPEIDDADLDPTSSAALHQELPSLAVALDADAMAERLQRGLADASGHVDVIDCAPTKALYTPGVGCSLRYRVQIQNGAPARAALIGARLFPTSEIARSAIPERVRRLAAIAHRDGSATPPVLTLDDLDMLAYGFPIDDRLPTLVGATNPDRVLDVLRPVLPEAFVPDGVAVDLVHYPREQGCVLRFDVDGRAGQAGSAEQFVAYGKVGTRHYDQAASVTAALRARIGQLHERDGFRVPRYLRYEPALDLTLMEAIPGRPIIGELIRRRLDGELDATEVTLDRALEVSAAVAAVVHDSGIPVASIRTLEGELRTLDAELDALAPVAPTFVAWLRHRTAFLARRAASREPLSPVFCHGDLTPAQVLFDGQDAGLVDFDTFCRAEPAFDVGRFSAYVRVAVQRGERSLGLARTGMADDACGRFVDTYLEARGTSPADRRQMREAVTLYEGVALVRMAIRSWRQLKATRTRDVVAVIRDRFDPDTLAARP